MHTNSTSIRSRSERYDYLGRNPLYGARLNSADCYVLVLALVLLAGCGPRGGQQGLAATGKNAAIETKPVSFKTFTVEFEVEKLKFQVDGNFTLGPESNGINLTNDNVNVKIGTTSIIIPPGSFRQNEKGKMKYKTEVDSLSWSVVLQDLGNGNFSFKATTQGPERFSHLKPEEVILTIGDDTGSGQALSGQATS